MSLASHEERLPFRELGTATAHRPRQRDVPRPRGFLKFEMAAANYAERRTYGEGAIAYSGIVVQVRGEKVRPRRPNGLRVSESVVRLDYEGDVLLLTQDMTATATWVSLNKRLRATGQMELDSIFACNAQPSVATLAQALGRRTIDGMDFGLVIDQSPLVKTVVNTMDGEAYSLAIPTEPIIVIQD